MDEKNEINPERIWKANLLAINQAIKEIYGRLNIKNLI